MKLLTKIRIRHFLGFLGSILFKKRGLSFLNLYEITLYFKCSGFSKTYVQLSNITKIRARLIDLVYQISSETTSLTIADHKGTKMFFIQYQFLKLQKFSPDDKKFFIKLSENPQKR